ncbi:endopeptidase La [Frisingicoccus sp.]|uniref:endopeptidase La n=1 Tax=Frisingicoccus sp. TaxID=1918627 RepID=UPI002E794DFB|nr:endopeptidase La [Frisingicoccus sp.]MEE0752046.1 endopeptidase La [Frisingicoccus sp.]
MNNICLDLPVIALRGLTILPNMIVHFEVSRERSKAAIEAAMTKDQNILLLTQKDIEVEEPGREDLYDFGTVAKIKQLVKLPKDSLRVMVEGTYRAHLDNLVSVNPMLEAEVTVFDKTICEIDALEQAGYVRYIHELLQNYAAQNPNFSVELVRQLLEEENLLKLVDQLCTNLPMEYKERQKCLEAVDLQMRFENLVDFMNREIEMIRITREIQEKVKERVDKNQREYILREQMKVIREELGEDNTQSDAEQFEAQLAELEAGDDIKEKIQKEIDRFRSSANMASENGVIRGYVETLLAMPWDKKDEEKVSLKQAQEILDEDHYGLEKVKERILEYLSVRLLTGKGESPILCLVGPPGTGKSSIARSVARALDKRYVRISLGGVRDEAEIRGHRKTYVGAMPGRIASALKNAGVKNPLMLLDEVDKTSNDYKGDVFSALLEVLDSEQNSKFRDNYIELPIDLSEVLFIATANTLSTIPRPLLDRMEIIEVNSYTENEKMHIAKEHLIPKQIKIHGLKKSQVSITDRTLEKIIMHYTREAGVRNLERRIGDICRKAAREIVEEDKKSVKVGVKALEKYLGKERYTFDEANSRNEVGIVRGLAWTSVGGVTLSVEVNVLPGKGKFELTGQIGDVMKESARAGISFIRSMSETYHIAPDFFDTHDMHIHIPEGAVPKDGPSAGTTMATAMISAITGIKVKASVAMTGEITLRGRVLPIGGLKEKILAAKAAKIKTVIVPAKNRKDVEEMDAEICEGLEIVYAESMKDVLETALVQSPEAEA